MGERNLRVAIIGAGPGGLCMGIKLREAGFDDFVILERADGVGGTWRRNTYPGAACDVPTALYSFSFEVKRDWSRPYAQQPEILQYFEELAENYDLLPNCRFGTEVAAAHWDEGRAVWELQLASGETLEAEVVISALGMFNELAWPDIEGLHDFAGTMFHSADWNWDHDLTGDRVAVIGSAASAVQFLPEIAPKVGQLHIFQRTPNWILPKIDTPYTEEQLAAFRADPALITTLRQQIFELVDATITFADANLVADRQAVALAALDVVEDPEVRRKLTPDHLWGCKRPLMSNEFLPMFNRPNVELVTDPIQRVTADGVVTADGTARQVDTLIVATGFAATKYLSAIDVVGRGGRHIQDAWNDGATAYLGITTSGFPNLFMLYGPNTNNGSILTMIEYQVAHIVSHLRRLVDDDLDWVDVRPEPMARYNDEVQQAIDGVTVWQDGCNGYYRTPSGRVVTQWPFSMSEFRRRTETIDPADYDVGHRQATPV